MEIGAESLLIETRLKDFSPWAPIEAFGLRFKRLKSLKRLKRLERLRLKRLIWLIRLKRLKG